MRVNVVEGRGMKVKRERRRRRRRRAIVVRFIDRFVDVSICICNVLAHASYPYKHPMSILIGD